MPAVMDYLPLFLRVKDHACLVVGGGEVAARKVVTLCQAHGRVTVLSPQICDSLRDLVVTHQIEWKQKEFEPADVEGYRLVIAATDCDSVNEEVSRAAHARNILVNVVDGPRLCSFIFPAIVDRSPIIAAISSGGTSPVLARLLRGRLETLIPPGYGTLARFAERFRSRVKRDIPHANQRRHFWESVLQGSLADLVLAGRENEAAAQLQRQLATRSKNDNAAGMVYLVGAGPGDPDLLTIRAWRLIQEADVVVYDRLVSPEIMQLVRRDAEKIYAGKQRSRHTLPQEQINQLLAQLAKSGKRVVRLKGGDPFIFGRGGEEIETLMEQGVHFQVVPGITAASGCAAYAGIPLTHRDYAHSCIFITGHLKDGSIADLDWHQLARAKQTLVIYMGLQGLPRICASLIRHGCAPDLPAALIQKGTTHLQRVISGTLRNLPDLVSRTEVHAPTLVIIGDVVRLRQKLAWFETARPPTLTTPSDPESRLDSMQE